MEKHFWIGLFLLIGLLVLSLGITWFITAIHTPSLQELQQAAQAAMQEDMPQAQMLAFHAKTRWERFRSLSAAVADHDPIEEADSLFAELEVYAQSAAHMEFAACCARLGKLMQAMVQAHKPSWWNLL